MRRHLPAGNPALIQIRDRNRSCASNIASIQSRTILIHLVRIGILAISAATLALRPAAAMDQPPGDVGRGGVFVQEHCTFCHAVGRTGSSPYAPAPPFRTLHEKYAVEGLAEAFAEGIVVAHKGPREMPQFMLSPEEIDDLIAYLKSLETPSAQDGRHAP